MLCSLALVVAEARPANAYYTLGHKWSTASIKYYVPTPLSSYTIWTGAASQWSGLDASLTWSSSNVRFTATQENRGNTVGWTGVTRKPGTTQSFPQYSGGYWVSGGMEVVLNWTAISGYTTSQKKMVASHELGHAFGLAHNPAFIPGTPGIPMALMYPYDNTRIAFGILSPTYDDKAGINAIY